MIVDLVLEFHDGSICGEGADGIAFFGIDGRYYPKEAECSWIKTYFGSHSVGYLGFREKKGIWGTWTILRTKGGFHIWPIGEGAPLEKLRAEVEDEFPLVVSSPKQPNKAPLPMAVTSSAGEQLAPAGVVANSKHYGIFRIT